MTGSNPANANELAAIQLIEAAVALRNAVPEKERVSLCKA
jgi:hypothetical protein